MEALDWFVNWRGGGGGGLLHVRCVVCLLHHVNVLYLIVFLFSFVNRK